MSDFEPESAISRDSEDDMERLRKAARVLGEHFDTVQIFCTRFEGEGHGTIHTNFGTGNWHARYGQVKEWAIACDEDIRINRRQLAAQEE